MTVRPLRTVAGVAGFAPAPSSVVALHLAGRPFTMPWRRFPALLLARLQKRFPVVSGGDHSTDHACPLAPCPRHHRDRRWGLRVPLIVPSPFLPLSVCRLGGGRNDPRADRCASRTFRHFRGGALPALLRSVTEIARPCGPPNSADLIGCICPDPHIVSTLRRALQPPFRKKPV